MDEILTRELDWAKVDRIIATERTLPDRLAADPEIEEFAAIRLREQSYLQDRYQYDWGKVYLHTKETIERAWQRRETTAYLPKPKYVPSEEVPLPLEVAEAFGRIVLMRKELREGLESYRWQMRLDTALREAGYDLDGPRPDGKIQSIDETEPPLDMSQEERHRIIQLPLRERVGDFTSYFSREYTPNGVRFSYGSYSTVLNALACYSDAEKVGVQAVLYRTFQKQDGMFLRSWKCKFR